MFLTCDHASVHRPIERGVLLTVRPVCEAHACDFHLTDELPIVRDPGQVCGACYPCFFFPPSYALARWAVDA